MGVRITPSLDLPGSTVPSTWDECHIINWGTIFIWGCPEKKPPIAMFSMYGKRDGKGKEYWDQEISFQNFAASYPGDLRQIDPKAQFSHPQSVSKCLEQLLQVDWENQWEHAHKILAQCLCWPSTYTHSKPVSPKTPSGSRTGLWFYLHQGLEGAVGCVLAFRLLERR